MDSVTGTRVFHLTKEKGPTKKTFTDRRGGRPIGDPIQFLRGKKTPHLLRVLGSLRLRPPPVKNVSVPTHPPLYPQ